MKLYEFPIKCPVCQGHFHVNRLGCENCGSILEGSFELSRLARLSKEMQQFVIVFLECRGNIREMEKYFSISYPTVRARIDEIVTALGGQDNSFELRADISDSSGENDAYRVRESDPLYDTEAGAYGIETEAGINGIDAETDALNINAESGVIDFESEPDATRFDADSNSIIYNSEANKIALDAKEDEISNDMGPNNINRKSDGVENDMHENDDGRKASDNENLNRLNRLSILTMLANGEIELDKAQELLK